VAPDYHFLAPGSYSHALPRKSSREVPRGDYTVRPEAGLNSCRHGEQGVARKAVTTIFGHGWPCSNEFALLRFLLSACGLYSINTWWWFCTGIWRQFNTNTWCCFFFIYKHMDGNSDLQTFEILLCQKRRW
jgi:hypothetical protein